MLFLITIVLCCHYVKEELDDINEDVELPGYQRVCHHTKFYIILFMFSVLTRAM